MEPPAYLNVSPFIRRRLINGLTFIYQEKMGTKGPCLKQKKRFYLTFVGWLYLLNVFSDDGKLRSNSEPSVISTAADDYDSCQVEQVQFLIETKK